MSKSISIDEQNKIDLAVDEVAKSLHKLGLTPAEIYEEFEYQAERVCFEVESGDLS